MEKVNSVQRKNSKKITLVYGSASSADNPTDFACRRIREVMEELGLQVEAWRLTDHAFEDILDSVTTSAGVVLATTVEWFGIGFFMQRFLDQCHQVQREGMFDGIPLLSVVFSREAYEKEAGDYLTTAWQLLGGWQGVDIYGCYPDVASLSADLDAMQWLEKKVEQFFRYGLSQNAQPPRSAFNRKGTHEVKTPVPQPLEETVAEPEDEQTRRQKENIVALSGKLKAKLEEKTKVGNLEFPEWFSQKYKGNADREYLIQLLLTDQAQKNTALLIKTNGIHGYYGVESDPLLTITLEEAVLRQILEGRVSFRRAFMTGKLSAKGELNLLYKMDELF